MRIKNQAAADQPGKELIAKRAKTETPPSSEQPAGEIDSEKLENRENGGGL